MSEMLVNQLSGKKKKRKRPQLVIFGHFCGVNAPAMAHLKLPTDWQNAQTLSSGFCEPV